MSIVELEKLSIVLVEADRDDMTDPTIGKDPRLRWLSIKQAHGILSSLSRIRAVVWCRKGIERNARLKLEADIAKMRGPDGWKVVSFCVNSPPEFEPTVLRLLKGDFRKAEEIEPAEIDPEPRPATESVPVQVELVQPAPETPPPPPAQAPATPPPETKQIVRVVVSRARLESMLAQLTEMKVTAETFTHEVEILIEEVKQLRSIS